MKCEIIFVFLFGVISMANSSAIPMWEFLSKQEKMSYLYSMLKNQVEEFCGENRNHQMKNCKEELLKYGVGKLRDMPEDHLDIMDPYQRGANDLIWDSMMEGHEMMKTTRKTTTTTTTPKPNSYEDSFDFGNSDEDLNQFAASAKIDNIYRVPPPKDFVYQLSSGKPQYTYPQNFLYQPVKYQQNRRIFNQQPPQPSQQSPLTGPMVIKVYPDGRPVRDQQQNLPQDEDLRQYQMSKTHIPNF